MLAQSAIDNYLDAPRDSHVWIKTLSEKQLDRALAEQGFRTICPETPLKKHQKACVLLCLAYPCFSLWLDMGTGKTRIILELLAHYWRTKQIRKALVLGVSEAGVDAWVEQIDRWGFPVPYLALGNMSSEAKWAQIAEEWDKGVLLCSYPGLSWLLSKRVVEPKKKARQKKDKKLIQRFSAGLDAFVPDESTKLGRHDSLISRAAKDLSKECAFRYALAGRPFGKDPTMVWNQQYTIDRGESLGDTLGLFRAAFFSEKKGYFGGYEYTFKKSMEEKLAEVMGHRSISYSADECLSLPEVSRMKEMVSFPEDIQSYFDKAVKALRAAKGDRIKIKNIFLRMRQMSSGFLGYKDDETGARAELVFPHNPKLDHLLALVEEVPLDRKWVVFHDFVHSGKFIMEELRRRKITAGWLRSGADVKKELQGFNSNNKVRGLVASWHMAGMSVNLQKSNYVFFFESPVGIIDREQAERRCFRQGQQHKGFMYDLVVRGSMDESILNFHKKGEDLFQALVRNPNSVIDDCGTKTLS